VIRPSVIYRINYDRIIFEIHQQMADSPFLLQQQFMKADWYTKNVQGKTNSYRDRQQGDFTPCQPFNDQIYLGKVPDTEAMRWIENLYA
jgi:hypothetical protein